MTAIISPLLGSEHNRWHRGTGGRPPSFSPATLLKVAYDYFEWAEQNPIGTHKISVSNGEEINSYQMTPRPLLITEFCLYAGINEDTWYTYCHKVDYSETCKLIKNAIYNQKLQGAAVGLFKENIIARHLGLTDKKETKVSIEDSNQRLTQSTGSMLEQLQSAAIESSCETIGIQHDETPTDNGDN